jgi:hypothetical protein
VEAKNFDARKGFSFTDACQNDLNQQQASVLVQINNHYM